MKKIILLSVLVNLLIVGIPYGYCQSIGINNLGNLPDNSAILDINTSGLTSPKGLLIPRVQLTSTIDVTTIPSPATSLMVYNLANAGTSPTNVKPGFYYWDGAKWIDRLGSSTPFVDVYRSAALNIIGDANTKVIFNTEVEDVNGLYDNATGRLTLPSGIWKISVSSSLYVNIVNTNQELSWKLYKNGVLYKRGPVFRNYIYSTGANLDVIVRSNGTDYYETYLLFNNSVTEPLTVGSSELWMQAVKIGD